MALLISLLFFCAFISKALTLRCYPCLPGTCSSSALNCPNLCGSMTTTVYIKGQKQNGFSNMTCVDPLACVTGSVTLWQSRVTLNSQCCSADYCNNLDATDLPRLPLNGRQCFTCNGTDCLKTVGCEGNETQCFTTTVEANGKKEIMKGCSSKLLCSNNNATQPSFQFLTSRLPVQPPASGVYMKCCEGNLCNGVQSSGVYLLVLLPLLSLVVF